MSEWLKEPVSKTGIPVRVSWVRIPPCPYRGYLPSMLLLLAQAFTPGDCIFTGLCGVRPPETGLSSGVMFLALGLVLGGAAGLRRLRRRD